MAIISSRVNEPFVDEVIAAVPEGIISIGEEGTIVFANDRITELLGYEPGELVDRSIDRLSPEPSDESLLEAIRRRAATAEDRPGHDTDDSLLIHKDGREVPVGLSVEETRYEDQRFYTVTVRDVSGRTDCERALEEAEIRFEKTFEYATDPLMIVDPQEDVISECNDEACELLGYSREELLALGPSDVHPHDMDRFREFVGSTFEEGESWTDDLRCRTATGELIPAAVSGAVLDSGGRRHMLVRVRDITERKAEEREHRETQKLFEKIFDHSNDAIFIFDPKADEFTDVNPRACELLGYDREELLDMGPSDAHPHELESFVSFVEEVVEEGEGRTQELSCFTCDEEIIPAEISMSRIDLDGVPHVLANVRNVEERKVYESGLEALNETSRQLMTADSEETIAEIVTDLSLGEITTVENTIRPAEVLAMWSYDDEAERLVPASSSEAASDLARERSDQESETVPSIDEGTAEMELFRTGDVSVVDTQQDLDNSYQFDSLPETVLFAPVGRYGLIAIESQAIEEVSSVVVDLTRVLVQHVETAFDRLERERARRRHSTAMEAASDGIAILDDTEEIRYSNRAYAEMYGYDDLDDLLGETWHRLYSDDETSRFEEEILPTVREQGYWRGEAVGTRVDDTTFPQELSLTPLEDGGLVCVVRDITERKEYERRLEGLNETDQELSRAETVEKVARTSVGAVERLLGVDVGCVRLYDSDRNALEAVAMTDEAESLVESSPAFDLESTLAGRAYRQEMIVHNEQTDGDSFGDTPVKASLHLPLGEHGILTVLTRDESGFTKLERALAEALAASVQAALSRAIREETLRANERDLRQQHDELDTLHRLTSLVQEIGDHLIEASTRDELERTVCERVGASDLYRSAWIGEVGVTDDRVDICAGAGLEDTYLEALDRMPLSMLGNGTVERTLETGEIEVVRQYDTTDIESEMGDKGDIEATAAIPLAYGDRIHGVLVVNGVREDVFSKNALAGFESLSKLVGFAISALRTREILLSDAVVELDLTVVDRSIFYSFVTAELECRCRFDRSVPIEDGRVLNYHRIEGGEPKRILELAEEADDIESAEVVSEGEDDFVLQTVTDVSLRELALDARASLQSAVVEDGEARVTLEAPRSADIREVVTVFETAFASVELAAKREREREVQTAAEFRERIAEQLTDKQRATLEAAYAAGYYDWPREITAEELATSMDVSSSTVHQHLRKGVWSLLDAFFEESEKPVARQ